MLNVDLVLLSTSRTRMAANSNMGFNHEAGFSYSYNWQSVSFLPEAMNSAAGLAPGAMNTCGAIGSLTGMMVARDPSILSNASAMIQAGGSSKMLPERVTGLRSDSRPSRKLVVWSSAEQAILGDGLVKYANLPPLLKYIYIASMLREKTIRDVALRCGWMNKKANCGGCKQEKKRARKQIDDRKEKMVAAYSKVKERVIPSGFDAECSLIMQQVMPNLEFSNEAIDATTQQLMDENAQLLHQISENLTSSKIVQYNVDLFNRMRNNITTILKSMSEMPGIMSRMPSLPEPINEELVNVLDGINQALIALGSQGSSRRTQRRKW